MSCKKDVEKVEVNPSTLSLKEGQTSQLNATVTPEKAEYTLAWTSSNSAVATVDGNGKVTAIAEGTATITAEAGGKKGTCMVTVKKEDVPPTPPTTLTATVILTAGDVWSDGSGYQMLLDADGSAYGDVFPAQGALTASGNVSSAIYNAFEYKIPANADGNLNTSNIVFNTSVSIEIPAGTYDFCITNPTPDDKMWIAAGDYGRADDFVFEEGKTYEFTVSSNGEGGDQVTFTIDGIAAKRATNFVQKTGSVKVKK
jgi:hypothetical protein